MNKFNLTKHGDIRRRSIPVNGGRTVFQRREKFCSKHGWIDLFQVDEVTWQRLHSNCDKEEETGATFDLQVMKKAA